MEFVVSYERSVIQYAEHRIEAENEDEAWEEARRLLTDPTMPEKLEHSWSEGEVETFEVSDVWGD